jgi:hypothetical protein
MLARVRLIPWQRVGVFSIEGALRVDDTGRAVWLSTA